MNANAVDFPPVYLPDAETEGVNHTLFGSTLVGTGTKSNPYADMVKGYSTQENNSMTAMLSLNQDFGFITKNLALRVLLSANTSTNSSGTRSYSPLYYTIDEYDRLTDTYTLYRLNPTASKPLLGNVSAGLSSSVQYYGEARLSWSRDFNGHNVGAMVVGLFQDKPIIGASGSIFNTLPERNLGLSGRFTYGFNSRYFTELSFGYNGSEKFTGKKQFGFFPSAGFGWMVSNESFWQPLKDVVSNLKFRGTYGIVGNDAIAGTSGRFWFLSDISLGSGGFTYGENFTTSYGGFTVNRYPNPDISWEEARKINLGIELGLLKGSPIKIEFDVFKDDRRRIYMQRSQIPLTAGHEAAIYGNNGRIKSQGADGSIDLQYSFSKDWWMTGRFNYTYSVNEYILLNEPDYSNTAQWYLSRVGHNANQALVYVAERLFLDDSEIASSPTQQFASGINPLPGDIKYADINGDGVVNANDRIYSGYPTVPEIQYGFGLSTGFKKFDISFFFAGNTHTSFIVSPTGIQPFVGRRNAMKIVMDDYYDPENPDIYAFWPRLSVESIANNVQSSTWWMRNGGFLRLKTIEFGYNVPNVQRILLQSCRVYGTVQNVFFISRFKQWDPEMGGSGLGYPLQRAYNLGIQFTF
jgi:TonB-linked SusC/RagA family outer membrane protein